MKRGLLVLIAIITLVIGIAIYYWNTTPNTDETTNSDMATSIPVEEVAMVAPIVEATDTEETKTVVADEVASSSAFDFSADIPSTWGVDYVPGSDAINFYDPDAPGDSTLERSQIFVKYFTASQFLTLQTVTIHSREETTINGRPVVIYDIEKNAGVANFAAQPAWRNERHVVTDIRSTDASPTLFYVFGKHPSLDQDVFDHFIQSVEFNPSKATTSIRLPVDGFFEQSTLKQFGTYITPANSPVQPERFSGYHTGVDIETTEEQQNADVPIVAIADGIILLKRNASGYGGVVVIEHTIEGETYSAIYGHLRLSSVVANVDDAVHAGDTIGLLGTGFTAETDNERKHLHFALLPGTSTDLAGYVGEETELSAWVDPLHILPRANEHGDYSSN